MNLLKGNTSRYAFLLSCAVLTWLTAPPAVHAATVSTKDVYVKATAAEEEAKFESQQKTIITKKDIEKKQAKSAEDIVFQETGVTRTVDSMGNVGVSIRGAEPRHTLILVDGQEALGGLAKYSGAGDELQRIGTENVDHIEIIQGAASAKYGSGAMGGVINVITTKPTKKAGLKFNVEGRRDRDTAQSTPGTNAYLRADSGKIGKISFALYSNKRDLLPIYSNRIRREVLATQEEADANAYEKNSLRFYGTNANAGISAHYDIDANHKLDTRADHYQESLERFIKRTTSYLEPQVHYKRDLKRNTGNIAYTGKNDTSDWKVEFNYTRTKETDITLTSDYGKSTYEGKNTLDAVDEVNHGEWKGEFTMNRQVNDKHLLSYGFGYAHEDGEGSRVKMAPETYLRSINPYDYDKSLYVHHGEASSKIHKYNLKTDKNGALIWNKESEYYGYHGEKQPPYDERYKPKMTDKEERNMGVPDNWGDPIGNAAETKKMLAQNPDRYKAYSFVDKSKPWGYDTERKFLPQFTYEEWKQYLDPSFAGKGSSSHLTLTGGDGTNTDKERRSLFSRNPDAYYRYKAFNETLNNLETARQAYNQYIINTNYKDKIIVKIIDNIPHKEIYTKEQQYEDHVRKYIKEHNAFPEDYKPTMKDYGTTYGNAKDLTDNYGTNDLKDYYALLYYGTTWNFPSAFMKTNGKIFREEYNQNQNKQLVGKAALNKAHVFLQDTWQLNENTMLYPIIRLDHTNLFGNNVSFTMGVTHTLGGNVHRRFKANVGTSYTAPGLGELYYCWEMFGPHVLKANPDGSGTARLGWYWQGNPDLKPEKGFNVDISIEGENAKTYTKLTLFHNKIDNYLTLYNTGKLIDFNPEADESTILGIFKYFHAPDRIYSFKNIGRAEITGAELEIKHQFNASLKGRIGYTWLHAVNLDDPTMPRQLLDKPQHKINIGLDYENKKTGWSGSIWGEYYIHMLDSNSVAGNKNTLTTERIKNPKQTGDSLFDKAKLHYDVLDKKTVDMYQRKTYGMWNIMIQKKINKDSLVYFGIDNLFNHRDDDRAFSARTFRFGANFKLGLSAKQKLEDFIPKELKGKISPLLLAGFLDRPFDAGQTTAIRVFGDYRARMDSHLGENRPAVRVTESSSIDDGAVKALQNKADHGFSQRIRLGLHAKVAAHTHLTLVGSAAAVKETDTAQTAVDNRSINKVRIEKADITRHTAAWDVSLGRLNEKMGITGYWFNQSFDGARLLYTDKNSQFRVGFGDFSHSTGVTDSAYTHAEYDVFYRTPTVNELMGVHYEGGQLKLTESKETYGNKLNYYRQLANIRDAEASSLNQLKAEKQQAEDSANEWYKKYSERADKIGLNNAGKDPECIDYDAKMNKELAKAEELKTKIEQAEKELYPHDLSTRLEVLQRLQSLAKKTYSKELHTKKYFIETPELTASYTHKTHDEDTNQDYDDMETFTVPGYAKPNNTAPEDVAMRKKYEVSLDETRMLTDGKAYLQEWYQAHKTQLLTYYNSKIKELAESKAADNNHTNITIKQLTEKDLDDMHYVDKLYEENFTKTASYNSLFDGEHSSVIANYFKGIQAALTEGDGNSPLPREAFEKEIGRPILTKGNLLRRDTIDPINRAIFFQYRRKATNRLGLTAWFFRSVGNQEQQYKIADYDLKGYDKMGHKIVDNRNDTHVFRKAVNVFAIGAKYQVTSLSSISFDFGINRSELGRYLNGNTKSEQYIDPSISDPNSSVYTSRFLMNGRTLGKNPKFFDIRFDFGRHDYRLPGSWSAFGDYKYFEHGAFFGGNGTEGLPDRYLDGVKSFTLGGAYVPRKNMLLEAYYTFDAQSTGKRDTLYGPEQFKLGNYTRLQLTYKF